MILDTRISRRAFLGGLGGMLGAPLLTRCRDSASRWNVLFVSLDDLNDWISPLGGYHGVLDTPAFARLAARGVLFTNAHCSVPSCNPSRASALTGLAPETLGMVGRARENLRDVAPDVVTLPQCFKAANYWSVGLGKVFHRSDPISWDRERFGGKDPVPAVRPLNGWLSRGGARVPRNFDWGPIGAREEAFVDHQNVAIARQVLANSRHRPLFLGVGFRKPHLPWYLPRRFYDLHPLESIVLPTVRADDLDDVPRAALRPSSGYEGEMLHDRDLWRSAVQGYLAAISFVDAQLGALLDALDESPIAEDTLIALWSDHGYHLGQKLTWRKFTLWEEATRVPLILALPGRISAGRSCAEPVSLLDLYPTLVELCGLPAVSGLAGESLAPLVRDPAARRQRPAVTTWEDNRSVRTRRWRYTRYADGGEELYDHDSDPNEWVNLAGDPDRSELKQELLRWIDPAHRDSPQTWR